MNQPINQSSLETIPLISGFIIFIELFQISTAPLWYRRELISDDGATWLV